MKVKTITFNYERDTNSASSLNFMMQNKDDADSFCEFLFSSKDRSFSVAREYNLFHFWVKSHAFEKSICPNKILSYFEELNRLAEIDLDLPSEFIVNYPGLEKYARQEVRLPLSCSEWVELELGELITQIGNHATENLSKLAASDVTFIMQGDRYLEINCQSSEAVSSLKKKLFDFSLENKVDEMFYFKKIKGVIEACPTKFLIKINPEFDFQHFLHKCVESYQLTEENVRELTS